MSAPVDNLTEIENMEHDALYPRLTGETKRDYQSINIPDHQIADPADEKAMEQEYYPHLSAQRIRDFKSIKATHEQILRADQAAKEAIDKTLKRQTLSNEAELTPKGPSVSDASINVAVIGTSGSGKSATANTLLREKRFHESTSAISQTADIGPYTSKQSSPLTITDTSGSWTLPKITTDTKHQSRLYVLVINLASPRFGREELKKIRSLKDYYNIMNSKRCIILLTHASDALQGKSLYEYVQEIKGDPLYDLIMKDMERWRVMAINNNCDTKYEADKQHEMIVKLLQKTYEEADLKADNPCKKAYRSKVFQYGIVAAVSFVVIFLVVFLSVWFTTDVPPALITTTMQPNMTTGTTAPLTTTDTAGTGTTQSPATGTAATQTRAVGTDTSQEPPTRKLKSGG